MFERAHPSELKPPRAGYDLVVLAKSIKQILGPGDQQLVSVVHGSERYAACLFCGDDVGLTDSSG